MKIFVQIILVLITSLALIHPNFVLGKATAPCEPHNVCVHPGDYLKYQLSLGSINSSATYTFGNMTGPADIIVKEQYDRGSKTANDTLILDVRTGYGHSLQENLTGVPFLVVLPTPIEYNQSDISVSEGLKDFNGFKRSAVTAVQTSDNGSSSVVYDIQTGVLLHEHSIKLAGLFGRATVLEFSNTLIDTNIINSDLVIKSSKNIVLPAWIKNTAKWWADGIIGDADFVKAIQYLISKGIMQMSHGPTGNSSSDEIPKWVKSNAGWWSQGKISDDDFMSGIQYLINSGIVKV